MKRTSLTLCASTCLATLAAVTLSAAESANWKSKTISPVANPVYFEDPHLHTEIRPIFIQHYIDDDFITGGGDIRLYALQARWAVTDRFAIIATKDGYIQFNPDVGNDESGWANIAAGVKYAAIVSDENQFILTPGVTLEVPTGNERVFQGTGAGEWNLFASAQKGWDNLHLTGNLGFRIPNNFDDQTAQAHYSLQLDYWTCQYFIPFIVANGFTVLDEAKALPIDSEGYDLINFGSSRAAGWTGISVGAGFRSRILENLDLGFAYEKAVVNPEGLFDYRFTIDAIIRF